MIVASLEVMDDFFKVDDSHSLQQLKSRAEELLQFQILKLLPYVMHYDIKELTSSQTMKMLDMVEAKIKRKRKANNMESNELMNQ